MWLTHFDDPAFGNPAFGIRHRTFIVQPFFTLSYVFNFKLFNFFTQKIVFKATSISTTKNEKIEFPALEGKEGWDKST